MVASPVSDLLYLRGLAGRGNELVMRDIPEFLYLKSFEEVFRELERDRANRILSLERFSCFTEELLSQWVLLFVKIQMGLEECRKEFENEFLIQPVRRSRLSLHGGNVGSAYIQHQAGILWATVVFF